MRVLAALICGLSLGFLLGFQAGKRPPDPVPPIRVGDRVELYNLAGERVEIQGSKDNIAIVERLHYEGVDRVLIKWELDENSDAHADVYLPMLKKVK